MLREQSNKAVVVMSNNITNAMDESTFTINDGFTAVTFEFDWSRDGAAGAAGVRHPAPAPAVLVVRAAADHVDVHSQVIQLVPAALRRRADAGDEELEGAEQLAAVATSILYLASYAAVGEMSTTFWNTPASQ